MKRTNKGFAIVAVLLFTSMLLLMVSTITYIGCSEIMQSKGKGDRTAAYDTATSGAEMLYTKLRYKSVYNYSVTWPQTLGGNFQVNGVTIGTYTALASTISSDTFAITATGTAKGETVRIHVKFGFIPNPTVGIPAGALGEILINGTEPGPSFNPSLTKNSLVSIDGPVESNGTISTDELTTVNGETLPEQDLQPINWWVDADGNQKKSTDSDGYTVFDVDGDGTGLPDRNEDGKITIDDVAMVGDPPEPDPTEVALLSAEDIYPRNTSDPTVSAGDGVIDDKDAFFQYYTHDLNEKYSLNIGPGESNYYSGETHFGTGGVREGIDVVFVDGDVSTAFSASQWRNQECDLSIISMENITIEQPINGSDDRLTIVAWGDVTLGSLNFDESTTAFGTEGDFTIYAHGNIAEYGGGTTQGSSFCEGSMTVDTLYPNQAKKDTFNRTINRSATNWADAASKPLGLPPNYPSVTIPFSIKPETSGTNAYKPRWQRT